MKIKPLICVDSTRPNPSEKWEWVLGGEGGGGVGSGYECIKASVNRG